MEISCFLFQLGAIIRATKLNLYTLVLEIESCINFRVYVSASRWANVVTSAGAFCNNFMVGPSELVLN